MPFGCNSSDRARVIAAKRGSGTQPKASEAGEEKTPAERRAAMAGFCSCKTGIRAIHGKNVGAAAQAHVWHRHRDLVGLPRGAADHRLYREPRGDQEDSTLRSVKGAFLHHSSRPPRHQRCLPTTRPVAALSGATVSGSVLIGPTTHSTPPALTWARHGSARPDAQNPPEIAFSCRHSPGSGAGIQAGIASKAQLRTPDDPRILENSGKAALSDRYP